jgi:cation:H+ antiporter
MEPIITLIFLIIGLYLLVKGADYLVDASCHIARSVGISEFVIGLTLVAIGTSLPETVVSAMASITEHFEISVANIIGSNIYNVFIIVGITAFMRRHAVKDRRTLNIIIFCVALASIWFTFAAYTNTLNAVTGLMFIFAYLAYIVFSFKTGKHVHEDRKNVWPLWKSIVVSIFGMFLLYVGGTTTVDSAADIAHTLAVTEWLIGATIIAAGTGFPETAVSIIAVRRRKFELSFGNILGSNLYNILGIMGVASILRTMSVNFGVYAINYLFLLASVIFACYIAKVKEFHKKTAIFSLLMYVLFIIYVIMRR